jgi:hypothetical protein
MVESLQEEITRAEITGFERQMQPARFGESPGYAWIDFGTDAERRHAKPLHHGA